MAKWIRLFVLCAFVATAAIAGNNAQFISQFVPQRLAPGQTQTVSVTIQNIGSTTWDWDWYKLSAENPTDNTVWLSDPRAYMNYGELIYPGQQKTFTFNITAPSTPGVYNFQWQMIQEYTERFGPLTPPEVITVSVSPCSSYADPNDTASDEVALQCLLDQGGTINLAPSAPGSEYGYIISGSGLNNHVDNLTLDSAPGTLPRAMIIASSSLQGAIPFRSLGHNYITLHNLIFDGNRDTRPWQTLCPFAFRPDVATVEVGDTIGSSITNNIFQHAVCGAALGVSGIYYNVDSNTFNDNGLGAESFPPNGTAPWADGIRVGSCSYGHITNNTFYDTTDLSLSIEETTGCDISGNFIQQLGRFAFGGIGFGNHSHPGTSMSYNTIYGNDRMSIGIAVGGNPWCGQGPSDGADIAHNQISGAYFGMNVQDSSHWVHENVILDYVEGGGCNVPKALCNSFNSSNVQPCASHVDLTCCLP